MCVCPVEPTLSAALLRRLTVPLYVSCEAWATKNRTSEHFCYASVQLLWRGLHLHKLCPKDKKDAGHSLATADGTARGMLPFTVLSQRLWDFTPSSGVTLPYHYVPFGFCRRIVAPLAQCMCTVQSTSKYLYVQWHQNIFLLLAGKRVGMSWHEIYGCTPSDHKSCTNKQQQLQ